MRILSGAPSNTEIVYALGLEEDLVGTTSLCDYPEKARKKPNIGGWSQNLDYERIEKLDPDIVLLSDQLQDNQASELEERGYEILQVHPESLNEVFQSFIEIGRRFDKEEKASNIVSEMKEEIEKIDLDSVRIYCEEWMRPPMVSGNWIPGLIEKANGAYFIGEERSREFDLDELKDFDPEYVFLNICGGRKNVPKEEVYCRPGWEQIDAIKNNDVYIIKDSLLNRPSPRIIEGLKRIEKKII